MYVCILYSYNYVIADIIQLIQLSEYKYDNTNNLKKNELEKQAQCAVLHKRCCIMPYMD